MLYSKFYLKKEVRIPTILSIIIIIFSAYFLGKLFLTTTIPSRAQKGEIKKFEFSNIYSNQATIVWITNKPQYWWLIYGTSPNKLNNIAFDVRDVDGKKGKYINHYVMLKNLEANKTYYVKLTDGKTLIANNDSQPFKFDTSEKFTSLSDIKPSFGTVVNSKGEPLENTLVILSIENAFKLSALSKNNGEWLIPMNYIIDTNTKKQKNLISNEKVKLDMFDEFGNKSEIQTYLSNLSPLKEKVVIGKNYKFSKEESVLGKDTAIEDVEKIDFIYPEENSVITSFSPIIKGIGIPENEIKIVIKGENESKTYNLIIKKDGSWNISSPISLSPGKYELTLKTNDENKKEIEKIRTFTIAKSGEQVLGEATPSAITITPTPTPTQIIPTQTPTPTIPVTGGSIAYFSMISAALIILGFGFIIISTL